MERPHFINAVRGVKKPLQLSEEGSQDNVEVPDVINQYLRDYQRDGIKFLHKHYMNNSGAVLADDMGLGKTIQVISLMAAVLKKTGKQNIDEWNNMPDFIRRMEGETVKHRHPFLVIGPACVLYNWKSEFDTWGYFNVGIYHGAEKSKVLSDVTRGKLDVVITTYETCREHINSLSHVEWSAIFADEVHKIKTEKAEVRLSLKKFKCKRRFGLTGTPLQNRLQEFWCIMDWANPSCFGDLESFERKYVKPIVEGQRQEATKRQLAEGRKAQIELANKHTDYMLRRTKLLIADQLPKKEELVVYCKPTELQLSLYKSILNSDDVQFILRQNKPCDCLSGRVRKKCHYRESPSGLSVRSLTLMYMHLLLKTANHVALLSPHLTESTNRNEFLKNFCSKLFRKHPQLNDVNKNSFQLFTEDEYSGKLQILRGLLSVFYKQKSKVLLFSYSTKILDILQAMLQESGYAFTRLDGTIVGIERMKRVEEFNKNSDIFIFLISTKAGGVGLNLTGANVVIIFDPNWNPAHDLQAQDRAYRLGQTRDVRIYRLITSGMIEETIYLKQVYKQQLHSVTVERQNARRLFSNAVKGGKKDGGGGGGKLGGGELGGIENLFCLITDEKCRTENILLRNEQMEADLRGYQMSRFVRDTENHSREINTTSEDDDDQDIEDYSEEGNGFLSDDSAENSSSHDDDVEHDDDGSDDVYDDNTMSDNDNDDQPARALTGRVGEGERGRGELIKGSNKKCVSFKSVDDVLGHENIVHMHRNQLLVGGSRAEDHMTRCALLDVYELQQNSQLPAAACGVLSQDNNSQPEVTSAIVSKPSKESTNRKPADKSGASSVQIIDGTRILIGQTPPTIQRQQFQDMAKYFEASSCADFAELILSSSKTDLKQMLKKFYTSTQPLLKSFYSPRKDVEPVQTTAKSADASRTFLDKKKNKTKRLNIAAGDEESDVQNLGNKSNSGFTKLSSNGLSGSEAKALLNSKNGYRTMKNKIKKSDASLCKTNNVRTCNEQNTNATDITLSSLVDDFLDFSKKDQSEMRERCAVNEPSNSGWKRQGDKERLTSSSGLDESWSQKKQKLENIRSKNMIKEQNIETQKSGMDRKSHNYVSGLSVLDHDDQVNTTLDLLQGGRHSVISDKSASYSNCSLVVDEMLTTSGIKSKRRKNNNSNHEKGIYDTMGNGEANTSKNSDDSRKRFHSVTAQDIDSDIMVSKNNNATSRTTCKPLSVSLVDDILDEPITKQIKSVPKSKATRVRSKSVFHDILDFS